ncbi:Sphingosine-1-phosphate phosphatase 2 [Bulinus truncatus]|nr:Sphingosine-1-phosphate phosphatase 2 [Bulinus truncatus]
MQLKKILADPVLTADFQKLCGIRRLKDTDSSQSVNGNNVVTTKARNGNTYDGMITYAHSSETLNGVIKRKISDNGINGVQSYNGFLRDGNHTNGYCKSPLSNNNLSNDKTNGSAGNTEGEHKISNGNGFISNSKTASENGNGVHHSANYTIDNVFIYWLFSFGASLGNELFYILFFSFSIWNIDCYVIRRTIVVWGIIMYVGQAAKDIIKWPRPKSPPVIPLEERYELEYGMPSTHAMVGVAIPFSVFIFMCGRYELNIPLSLLIAVTWCLLVSLSRLYLGMHSLLDVIAGLLLATFIMCVTAPLVDPVDKLILSHELSIPALMLACIILCLVYPTMDRWSTTRGDTILILGVLSGIYSGLWMTAKLTDFKPAAETLPVVLTFPGISDVAIALLRQVNGVMNRPCEHRMYANCL